MRKSLWAIADGYLWVSIMLQVLITFIAWVSDIDLLMAIIIGVIGGTGIGIWMILVQYFGEGRHRSMIKGRLFQRLINEHGFRYETLNKGRYHGLIGTYREYTIRVYYDWSAHIPRARVEKAVVIMAYFDPPMNRSGRFVDTERIELLYDTYKSPWWAMNPKLLKFGASHLLWFQTFNFSRAYPRILNKLDKAIAILIQEDLSPIDERKVDQLVDQYYSMHGPEAETFLSVEDDQP